MKKFSVRKLIAHLPRSQRLVFIFVGLGAVGLFVYYISVVNPLFSHADSQLTVTTIDGGSEVKNNSAILQGNATSVTPAPIKERGFDYGLTNSYGKSLVKQVQQHY